ncbi:MAG: TolC family protein [Planctomycetota bacterium]|jgi:outer membrane protein TolC
MRIPHRLFLVLTLIAVIGACTGPEEQQAWQSYDHHAALLQTRDKAPSGITASEEQEVQITGTPSGLQDYLYYAGMHHPGLRGAFHRWKAMLERVPQAKALPEPRLTYGYFLREIETRTGSQEHKFSLMQKIPWPAKLSRQSDAAVRRAMVERYKFEGEKLKLFYEVKKAYYEYYFLARSIAIVEDNLQLLENMEAAIRVRYKASAADQPALIQTQVELGKLEDRLNSLKALKPALQVKLNSVIGWDLDTQIPLPEAKPLEAPPLEEAELLETLLEDNPALEAARAEIHAAQAEQALSDDQYWPDLGIGATYIQTDRRSDASPSNNGEDPVLLTLEVSLPLWRSTYDAMKREADANYLAARAREQDLENRLSAALTAALYHYEDAGRKKNLFLSTLLPKAEQSFQTVQSAFAAGQAGFLEMLDAERQLLEFRLLAERAIVDRNIRFAELEMLCGRELRR